MIQKKAWLFYVFFGLMTATLLAHWYLYAQNPGGVQSNIFFANLQDFFADFFNVQRYISGRDPYFSTINSLGEKAYLPISYLLLYPFTLVVDYGSMTLAECWNSHLAMISVIFYTVMTTLILTHAMGCLCKKGHVTRWITLPLLLSSVYINAMERGNLIVLTAAMICYFLAFYDSENGKLRFLAGCALALAAGLKVYPVIFGFLYFQKKQYKEMLIAVLITLMIIFLPFLFFKGGFSNLSQMLRNVQLNSESYSDPQNLNARFGINYLIYNISAYALGVTPAAALTLAKAGRILLLVTGVAAIAASVFTRRYFEKLMLLMFAVIFIPANSQLYCTLYFFPVIIVFFATAPERTSFSNALRMLLFFAVLTPLQISLWVVGKAVTNGYVLNILTLLAFGISLAAAVCQLIRDHKGGKLDALADKG